MLVSVFIFIVALMKKVLKISDVFFRKYYESYVKIKCKSEIQIMKQISKYISFAVYVMHNTDILNKIIFKKTSVFLFNINPINAN